MKRNSLILFLKRKGYYILLCISVIAIALMTTYAIVKMNEKPALQNNVAEEHGITENPNEGNVEDPSENVGKTVVFISPASNFIISKNYATDKVFMNITTKDYRGHNAIDFISETDDLSVLAAYDGTVVSATTDYYNGTTIVIDHGNGLTTHYGSLSSDITLKQGDKVKQGDVIGEMSDSLKLEFSEGAHLHFQVKENNVVVNPNKYLMLEEK